MTKIQNPKRYDLEDRTFEFAKNIALKECAQDGLRLLNEAVELRKIFSSILAKSD